MPFDPFDYRPDRPPPERPGPMAPTDRHGMTLLAGLTVAAMLITALLNFPYALEGAGRLAEMLGL